jgi:hypothetical protein
MTVIRNNGGSSQPVPIQVTPSELLGWVDLHTHPLANLAFGGKLFYGNVDFDPVHGTSQNGSNGGPCAPTPPLVNSIQLALGPENWVQGGYNATSNPCGDIIGWPATSVRDQVIQTTEKGIPLASVWSDNTYTSSGYPGFPTWPTWNDITHQKMWVDWIRRSFDGGQRVMVALAVNSKTLGDMTAGGGGFPPQPNDWPTDDAASADLQIQEIKNFVGRHSDFMEVARSSADVYSIVKSKKIAVVIGVEINNIGDLGTATSANRIIQGGGGGSGGDIFGTILGIGGAVIGGYVDPFGGQVFGAALGAFIGGAGGNAVGQTDIGANVAPVSAAALVAEVDRLYDEDVRYIFPVHLADNPIGGTAAYDDLFDVANIYEEGHAWNLACSQQSDGIIYQFNSPNPQINPNGTQSTPSPIDLNLGTAEELKVGFLVFQPPPIPCPQPLPSGAMSGTGNVNSARLTMLGAAAIVEMMKKGMLIDIDHMSQATANDTISLVQQCDVNYPLNSGHNGLRDQYGVPVWDGVTGAKWSERNLTLGQYQAIGQLHGMAGVGSSNADACSWMNNYNAVVQAMGNNPNGAEVIAGFGTDWVLVVGMPARNNANCGQPATSNVQYSPAPGASTGTTTNPEYSACIQKCPSDLPPEACHPIFGEPLPSGCHQRKECVATCAAKYPPNTSNTTSSTGSTGNGLLPMSSLGTAPPWNYNNVGVAHYGMLPDFLQDVQSLPKGQTIPIGTNLDGTPCIQNTGPRLGGLCPPYTLQNGAAVVKQMSYGAQYFYQTWRNAETAFARRPSSSQCLANFLNRTSLPQQNNPGALCPQGQTLMNCGTNLTPQCVRTGGACPTCPKGEYLSGGRCIKGAAPPSCGPGQHLSSAGTCVGGTTTTGGPSLQ